MSLLAFPAAHAGEPLPPTNPNLQLVRELRIKLMGVKADGLEATGFVRSPASVEAFKKGLDSVLDKLHDLEGSLENG